MSFGFTPLTSKAGLTAAEVQSLIGTSLNAADGRTGWVIGNSVSFVGASVIDLVGVPANARDIEVGIGYASGTSAAIIRAQVLDSSGAPVTSYDCNLTAISGSTVTSSGAFSATSIPLSPSVPAADWSSGFLQIATRGSNRSFSSTLFYPSARKLEADALIATSVVITGVRILISAGTFDGGSATLRWRR